MHLRVSTRRTPGRVYRYAQVVQSFRRDDGMPAHRVVANLGALSQPQIDALRLAFRAGAKGEALVLESEVADLLAGSTRANRRYLDLAVLLDCWQRWELSALLDGLLDKQATSLSLAEVVLPLVLQRCSAPGSKLEAVGWLPKTALPELLGLDISAFHNSRIHRALDTLYEVTGPLQEVLHERYQDRDGTYGALFMDVTDTYFEGIGCPMAELTKTKTEMPHKRCLGIVLLANERGYPVRWKVVGGKTKDWHAMGGLLEDIGQVPWLKQTPVVFDRAMGNQKTVRALKQAKVRFVTAAHVTEIESYSKKVPISALADIVLDGSDDSYEQDIKRIAEAARRAGFEEIHERLFAIELDVDVPASEQPSQEASPKRRRGRRPMAATHLRQARQLAQRMEADESFGREEAAVSLGISLEHLDNQLALLCLAPEVQERILEWGERFPFGEARLRKLIKLPPEAQLSALDEQLEALTVQLSTTSGDNAGDDDERIGPLRMVAYFNPQLFVDIRRRTAEHCEKLRRHAAQFNAELAAAKRSRSRDATYRKFSAELERLNYLGAFDIELEPLTLRSKTGKTITSFQGRFIRKEQEWKRRRRYDGFVLLLGDPLLPQSARELVQLYRIKDIVEKDFQSIKSAIKLRPVFHYTDPKVQAHVTVCMLALLLQRTLEQRLAAAGHPMTAPACIEALNTCHLNQRRTANGSPLYDTTQLTSDQQAIVDALDLRPLADEQHVRVALVPREPSLQEPSR